MDKTQKFTGGRWIVSMPHITVEGALGYMATMSNYPEAMADARLMAAAKELLDVAKWYRDVLEKCEHGALVIDTDTARANREAVMEVIAKAEGGY